MMICVVDGRFSVSCFGLLSRIVLMLHRCLVAKGKLWGCKYHVEDQGRANN